MTIGDALAKRIPRVRLPVWANEETYYRLPLLKDGNYGPWAELYDSQSEQIGIKDGCAIMILGRTTEDGYEEYTGPISAIEQREGQMASGYQES